MIEIRSPKESGFFISAENSAQWPNLKKMPTASAKAQSFSSEKSLY
ncbi:hypothetical protein IMZ16_05315 [Cruoricaptor ignavus]|uniref:Uncharacterized protein n=1 Tax=Cruoricaptor ignavus TaxID=1118202 RepID=A0A7M1SZI6_9FLAO|nr:hypothetical protein [Cruoricaptor ignavus]QOR72969.1 hypothetical protein IMZ16_05315 [Cruoricaptor ignavus]